MKQANEDIATLDNSDSIRVSHDHYTLRVENLHSISATNQCGCRCLLRGQYLICLVAHHVVLNRAFEGVYSLILRVQNVCILAIEEFISPIVRGIG
jgi:hypothetical protein